MQEFNLLLELELTPDLMLAFDVTKFFIVSLNALGSCYGSASPVTNRDGDPEKGRYGPEFPLTTIRDDVKYVAK